MENEIPPDLVEMIRTAMVGLPDTIPLPVEAYERIMRALRRMDRADRRRARMRRKKRRGW